MDFDEYVKDQNAQYLRLIEKHCSEYPGKITVKMLPKTGLIKVYTPDKSGKPTHHTMTVEIVPLYAPLIHHVKEVAGLAEKVSIGLRDMKKYGGLGVNADMREHTTPRTLPGYENTRSAKRE